MTAEEVMYGMMLESANDAAVVFAKTLREPWKHLPR